MSLLPLLAVVCSSFAFDAPRVYASPAPDFDTPYIADLDGDGRNDLVITDGFDYAAIHYGEPGGKLSEAYAVPHAVNGIGDLIGDARPDLFTPNGIAENLGGRHFAPPVGRPAGGHFFAHDFTGDRRNDLAIASAPNEMTLFDRMRDGTFIAIGTTDTGAYALSRASGDVDGDGRREIIAVGASSVRVFRYAGDGKFEVAATHVTHEKPLLVEAADLDRDGRDDIIVYLRTAAAEVEVFYGNSNRQRFIVGFRTTADDRLHVADVDNDGATDVVLGFRDAFGDTLSFHLNDGHGALRRTTGMPVRSMHQIAAGDLTGDGRTDFVVATALGMTVRPGIGDGLFLTSPLLPLQSASKGHVALDLDGDGADEIVYTDDGRVEVVWSNGTSGLVPAGGTLRAAGNELIVNSGSSAVLLTYRDGAWHKRTQSIGHASFRHVDVADFDGDGTNELVAVVRFEHGLYLQVYRGDGGPPLSSTRLREPSMTDGLALVVDDFTNDRVPDVALAVGSPMPDGLIAMYVGRADGRLVRIDNALENESPRELVSGDFNGDGLRDLAFTTWDFAVRVIYGQGARRFTEARTLVPASVRPRIVARDLNDDGITDLVASYGEAFLLALGTREGLVESGRWSTQAVPSTPLFARMKPHEAPVLLLSRDRGVAVIESTCASSQRRRSVRH